MKELSLHLLDVAKNSVAAGATWVDISLDEDKDGRLTIVISDNGRGMSPEFLAQVTDPFTTTRTTRKVGLGLPLDTVSWGSMLSLSEKALLTGDWWIILIPGAFLVATLMCVTELGETLRARLGRID